MMVKSVFLSVVFNELPVVGELLLGSETSFMTAIPRTRRTCQKFCVRGQNS